MVQHLIKPCRLHMDIHIYIKNKKTTSLNLSFSPSIASLAQLFLILEETHIAPNKSFYLKRKKKSLTRLFYFILW